MQSSNNLQNSRVGDSRINCTVRPNDRKRWCCNDHCPWKVAQSIRYFLLVLTGRLGTVTGLADWSLIKAVKDALNIPVFANGNMVYNEDLERCMKETGVDGIMTAEGNLCNPAIFQSKLYASWYLAEQYLQIVDRIPNSATSGQAKSHFFKLFHSCLPRYTDLRERLALCRSFDDIKAILADLKSRMIVRMFIC